VGNAFEEKMRNNAVWDFDPARRRCGFVAESPSLSGWFSQGKTRKKTLVIIQDASKEYLERLKKHNKPIPPSIEEEMVEVAV
jgi:antitoxin HicB